MAAINQLAFTAARTTPLLLSGLGTRLGLANGLPSAIKPKQYLRSACGQFSLVLSRTGELTINRVADSQSQWNANSSCKAKDAELRLSPDASLNIIDPKTGQVYWTTGPQNYSGHASSLTAALSGEGNLEIMDATRRVIWSTGNSQKPQVEQPVESVSPILATDRLLQSAFAEENGIGMLRMGDDESGTLHPIGGGEATSVTVYIRSHNDPVLATLYVDGDAARRIDVRLSKQTHSSFRVHMR